MGTLLIEVVMSDNGFGCVCDKLPGWVVGYDGDFKGFKDYVQESLDFYIECAKQDGDELPEELQGEYTIEYKYNVEGFLNYYRKIFTFSALENITGINQKQLANYAAGRSTPRAEQAEKLNAGIHKLANDLLSVTLIG